MIRKLLCLFLFWTIQASATPKWFDQSHEIFLTPELNTLASSFRDFPLFWWNFVVVEGETKWEDLENLCTELGESEGPLIAKLPCHFELKSLKDMTRDWLRDEPLRETFPGPAVFKQKMQETLSKASLPMGRNLVDLLRVDPLNSLQDLKERIEKRMTMDLTLKGGFLVDEKSHRVLMPVQFSFSPGESARTAEFMNKLEGRCRKIPGCTSLTLFGPHASTSENEMRIRNDVDVVSIVGTLALGLLCLFIFMTKRHKILLLVPILLFSILVSILVTIFIFGKIHGITLAFGPGIVGLAMDYGIHSCFLGPRDRKTWTANWIGIWTTIAIMIVLGFSAIPLLRQMMFFAVFGLCFSYFLFWVILRRWPERFEAQHYNLVPARLAFLNPIAGILLFSSALIFVQKVHLDIQHLNFEAPKTVEVREWFAKFAGGTSPYIVIEDGKKPLESSFVYKSWADRNKIGYEGIGNYLPPFGKQTANALSWRKYFCDGAKPMNLSEAETKFFAPYFKTLDCEKLYADPMNLTVPDYLMDFSHDRHFVGLFFPKTDAETKTLRDQYPQVSTPREIFESFPRIFYSELLWMVPLAFAASFFFLYLHYLKIGWSLLAVVPFLTGLGLYSLMTLIFHLPISFISLIGLLMVFGCSLDYGVFVMDFLLFRKEDRPGVWSALSLCAFATIAGFAPLVFAKHPVLNDLGQALLWGTLGTYIGSLWGIPSVYNLLTKWSAKT
ncbi:MAG: hypothetical protein ACXVA9_09680 [Bdellovibrionales bacterium]